MHEALCKFGCAGRALGLCRTWLHTEHVCAPSALLNQRRVIGTQSYSSPERDYLCVICAARASVSVGVWQQHHAACACSPDFTAVALQLAAGAVPQALTCTCRISSMLLAATCHVRGWYGCRQTATTPAAVLISNMLSKPPY